MSTTIRADSTIVGSVPVTLEIRQDVLGRFPSVSVSAVAVSHLGNAMNRLTDSAIDAAWADARESLAEHGINVESLADHDAVKPWREAAKRSGLKPSTFKSSIESLSRRLLRDGPLHTPVRAANLYCALSVKYLVPVGGYDLSRLPTGQISLRLAEPSSDWFEPLGGKASEMPMTGDVVVYASGSMVVCWSFNHRDARGSALTPPTCHAVFLSEALNDAGRVRSIAMLQELAVLLARHGAEVGIVRTLDRSQRLGHI